MNYGKVSRQNVSQVADIPELSSRWLSEDNRLCCDGLLYELHLRATDNEDRFRETVVLSAKGYKGNQNSTVHKLDIRSSYRIRFAQNGHGGLARA